MAATTRPRRTPADTGRLTPQQRDVLQALAGQCAFRTATAWRKRGGRRLRADVVETLLSRGLIARHISIYGTPYITATPQGLQVLTAVQDARIAAEVARHHERIAP